MPSSTVELIRRARSRTGRQGIGMAVVLTVAAWYFGADVWHALLLGGVLAVLIWIVALVTVDSDREETDWREHERGNRAGARSDIAQLSMSLRGRRGRVSDTAVWRVQRMAERRLAQCELNLRDPADRRRIEELIGPRSYRLLVRKRTARQPSLRAVVRCVDSLEALDPARHLSRPSSRDRSSPSTVSRSARER